MLNYRLQYYLFLKMFCAGTTDNASNATAGTRLLKLKQIGCSAHKVSLAVKAAIGGKFILSKHPDDD